MKKRILSMLLTIVMVIGMFPTAAFAAEADNLCEHHAEHTAECGYVEGVSDCAYHCDVCLGHDQEDEVTEEDTEPAPVCYCVEKCTAESFNEYCDVCGVDYSKCTGTDTATIYTDECAHSFTGGVCDTCGEVAVAKIGETFYASLAEAAEKAEEGDTIQVLADVDTDADIAFAAFVTLKVAEGKTINRTGDVTIGEDAGIIFENELYYYGDLDNDGLFKYNGQTYFPAGDGYIIADDGDTGMRVLEMVDATIYDENEAMAIGYKSTGGYSLKILFSGENTIRAAAAVSGNSTGIGLDGDYGDAHDLILSGGDGAVLNIIAGEAASYSMGIDAESVTITGGTVNVTSGNAGQQSVAINTSESVTVEEGATLNLTFGEAPLSFGAGVLRNEGTINGLILVPADNAFGASFAASGNTVLIADFTAVDAECPFTVPAGSTLTVNENVTLDLSVLAADDIVFEGTVINNGTILLPAGFGIENAPKGGTVTIGDKTYTWNGEKWICAEGSHVTELEENKATCTTQTVCDLCGTGYGELLDHVMDTATGLCTSGCGKLMAEASVTKSVAGGIAGIGGTTYYETLDGAIQAVSSCTEGDNAVVTLLKSIDLGSSQSITGGVFTLDLNGKSLMGGDCPLYIKNAEVTITDSKEGGEVRGVYYGVKASDSTVKISGGTVRGYYGVYATSNTVTISGGTVSGYYGVLASDSTVEISGGTVSGNFSGVYATRNTVTISGGSISGTTYDIHSAYSTCTLTLAEGKTEGATFPGGITVSETTLQAILGKDLAYWGVVDGKDTMLTVADDATSITDKGDITIRAICDHSGSAHTTADDNGDGTHSFTCTVCQTTVTEEHTGGTATCTELAECQHCGASYGELADHSTSYSADGMTITYKCATCDTQTVTFTLVIPTGAVYGSSAMAVPHYDCSDKTYNGDSPVITLDDKELKDFAFNAGTYAVTMTWGGQTVSGEYTIAPKELTADDVTITLSPDSFLYDGLEKLPTITIKLGDKTLVGGTYADGYTGSNTTCDYRLVIPYERVKPGRWAITVFFMNNYSGDAVVHYTITIPEAMPSPAAPNGENGWYNSVSLLAPDGYAISTTKDEAFGTSLDLPNGIHESIHYWLTYTDNANCEPVSLTWADRIKVDGTAPTVSGSADSVTDSTASITVTADDALSGVESVTLTCADASVTIGALTDGAFPVSGMQPNTAYTFTLTAKDEAGNETVATVNLTTEKGNSSVTAAPTPNTLTYTGEGQYLISAGEANGGTMVYSLSENGQYTATIPTGTNADEYTVWYYVDGDDNHSDSAKTSVTSVISKAELTITAKNHTITYGDAPAANGVVYSGFVNTESEAVLAGTLTYDFNYEQYGDVGTYKITPSGVTSGNYEIAFVSGDLSVTAKGLSVKAEAKTKIYGETDPELTYQADGLVGGDALTGTLERTSGENVGAYAIKQGTLTAGGNYTITYTGAALTINPKAITEADVELKGTLTYNGSEQIQQITGKNGITCDVTGNKANDVGTYELTVTGNGNYTGEVKLSYTVAKKPISVVWENTNLVYNGSAQSPVAKLAGVVTGDDVQAVVNGSGTNAGTYDATVSLTGTDAGNYALTGSTKFTIARAPVTFKVSNNSVEEGKAIAVTVISEPAGVGHTMTYRQNGDVVTPSAVGEYDIYVEITDSNYRHAASANGNAIKIGVLTIYEGKKPATYTLSYAPGEGSGTMAAEEAALAGTIRILPECTFTAPKDSNGNDMLFVGWADGNATYKAGEQYRQPEKNVTMTALWVVEKHDISGMVKQFVSLDSTDLVTRGGVVVTLMLGSKQVAQAVTDANGNYKFEHCLLGTYNLVAEYEGIRQTAKAVLGHSDMSDLGIDLPAGKTNSTVDVEPGTPDVVVGGLDEMMKTTDDKVFTEEDKEVVEQGGEVEIKMEVKENPAPEKKDDLEKKAEEISTVTEIGIFIDLDLTKTVTEAAETTGTTTTIAEASKLLENIIFLPGHLQGKNAYHVFREHGGKIEEMTELHAVPTGNNEGFIVDRVNHTITIYSMKYSTYAIAYTDSFTITFNANGGKVDVESAITGTDGTLESLPTPTRSGYTFKGWFTAESGGTEVTTDTVFNADKIIYAQWTMNYVPTPSGGSTNKITVSTALNGKVSADLSNAKEGTTVTITVEPDDGYELDELLVSDASGNELKVTANGNNKYSFVMPDSRVSIKATFVPDREECTGGDSCLSAQFSDLDPSLWYHEATDYVLENGLMNGVGGGKFDPNGTTSRAMIVTILWRLEGEPVVNYLMQFGDVAAESWYTEAVRWAASEKIVGGWNGKFDPVGEITREQFATILWRYAKYKGYDVSVGEDTNILSYEDAFSISEYAIPAMQWACGAGLMQGDGVNLTPKADATRAQAAALFQRFCENVAEK